MLAPRTRTLMFPKNLRNNGKALRVLLGLMSGQPVHLLEHLPLEAVIRNINRLSRPGDPPTEPQKLV